MIPLGDEPNPRRSLPVVTLTLIVINVMVFAYEVALGSGLEALFRSAGVVPIEFTRGVDVPPTAPLGSPWATLVTSMFLHGSLLHIGSNMLFLWIFGDNVEEALGHARYLLFYLLCGFVASAAHIMLNPTSNIPTVGASGAIAGVLGAYLIMFPSAVVRTLLFFFPFVMIRRLPAVLLIGLWFFSQIQAGVLSLGGANTSGVAVWAHVGGFVAGIPLALVMRRRG
jgi:membrane associated rhomboid family serine protease